MCLNCQLKLCVCGKLPCDESDECVVITDLMVVMQGAFAVTLRT